MSTTLPWWLMLRLRAHWLLPLSLLVLIVLIKDWPPPSCEKNG